MVLSTVEGVPLLLEPDPGPPSKGTQASDHGGRHSRRGHHERDSMLAALRSGWAVVLQTMMGILICCFLG